MRPGNGRLISGQCSDLVAAFFVLEPTFQVDFSELGILWWLVNIWGLEDFLDIAKACYGETVSGINLKTIVNIDD